MSSHDPRTTRQALLDEARCVAEEVDDLLSVAQERLQQSNSDGKAGFIGAMFQALPVPGLGELVETWIQRTRKPKVLAFVAGQVRTASDVLTSYFDELGGEPHMPAEVCGLGVIRDRLEDGLQGKHLKHRRNWRSASRWIAELREETQDERAALVEHRQARDQS